MCDAKCMYGECMAVCRMEEMVHSLLQYSGRVEHLQDERKNMVIKYEVRLCSMLS